MEEGTYTLVFRKLEEASAEVSANESSRVEIKNIQTESEEIAELRRMVIEVSAPTPSFYTGT